MRNNNNSQFWILTLMAFCLCLDLAPGAISDDLSINQHCGMAFLLLKAFVCVVAMTIMMNLQNNNSSTIVRLNELFNNEQNQRDSLRALLDAIPTPIYTKNVDGKYAGGNKALYEVMGIKGCETYGFNHNDMFPPIERHDNHLNDMDVISRGVPQSRFDEIIDCNGTVFPVVYLKMP